MCISNDPADFSGTKIMVHAPSPDLFSGKPVHVMAYQNTAKNLLPGDSANAMLLHIPSKTGMGPHNFIAMTDFPSVLDDMVEALLPKRKTFTRTLEPDLSARSVQIISVGIYTIVLANNASDIPAALHMVPNDKRPRLNLDLIDFYSKNMKGYVVALCCFNKSAKSEPLLFWYEPKNPNFFHMPALDEHTGKAPDLNAYVDVDHWLIASHYLMTGGVPVNYSDNIPSSTRMYLPERVIGRHVMGLYPNGDFGMDVERVKTYDGSSKDGLVLRLKPPSLS